MPGITVGDTLVLPRIPRPDPATSLARPVAKVVTGRHLSEGAGIRRSGPTARAACGTPSSCG